MNPKLYDGREAARELVNALTEVVGEQSLTGVEVVRVLDARLPAILDLVLKKERERTASIVQSLRVAVENVRTQVPCYDGGVLPTPIHRNAEASVKRRVEDLCVEAQQLVRSGSQYVEVHSLPDAAEGGA